MNKLATIEKITEIKNHPNGDRLDIVIVLGYQCITQKGLYKTGDTIVFVQPDTTLPKDKEWAEGYLKYVGSRVKAKEFRGLWSEGLIVPIELLSLDISLPFLYDVGEEVSHLIGVGKYVPPVSEEFEIIGALPYSMPKTDEERFENYENLPYGDKADLSLKIDGRSNSLYYHVRDDKFGATGRDFEVDINDENTYTIHINKVKDKIIAYCKKHNVSLSFRFENYGKGVQNTAKNPHSKRNPSIACFETFDIENRRRIMKGQPHYFIDVCEELDIEMVPIVERDVILTPELIDKYSKELKEINGEPFEGIVVKHPNITFKVMNKYYDSKKTINNDCS